MSINNRTGLRLKSSSLLILNNSSSSNSNSTTNSNSNSTSSTNHQLLNLNQQQQQQQQQQNHHHHLIHHSTLPPSTQYSSNPLESLSSNSQLNNSQDDISSNLQIIDSNQSQNSANSPSNLINSSNSSNLSIVNSLDSIINLTQKRINTLIYLKKVYQGKAHWFNTILLSKLELEKYFDHHKMLGRTTRFVVLGMSLSSLLDILTLNDFLRALINLLIEFDSISDDNFKSSKTSSLSKNIFKTNSKSSRKSSTTTDYSINLQDTIDSSFLFSPNIPFELDYFQVWITLSDILVEVYQRIITFISSTNSNSLSTSSTPNGSPKPISTPTFNHISAPIPPHSSIPLTGSQSNLNQISLEMIHKVDGKLKKLILILTKELDGIARNSIREELTLLDPMLSIYNLSSTSLSPLNSNSLIDPTNDQIN